MSGILQDRVDEELLAREAQRLGLDRGDLIVRRRLAQKMAFSSEDPAAVSEPSEAALRAYYARHKAGYGRPGRATLRHVIFSADRGAAQAQTAARNALARATAGEEPRGDPSLLPLTYADVSVIDLARDYGPAFASAVERAPIRAWSGPIESGLGVHLLKVERRSPAETPAFEAVRTQVRDDYLAQQRKIAAEAFLHRLRAKYRVEVAGVTP